jgi:hypothetical protein
MVATFLSPHDVPTSLYKNKKAELTKGASFGSSAMLNIQYPPLSVPFSRRVWLFQEFIY